MLNDVASPKYHEESGHEEASDLVRFPSDLGQDEEVVKMVARMNELKEKQEPGSTKKEKDAKKDTQLQKWSS